MFFLQERNNQNEEQNGYNCLTILNIIQIRFFFLFKTSVQSENGSLSLNEITI